jgi:hypothetical protein
MLDVLSGAMAAFLIIMVVLMPYYRKEHVDYQAIIAELREQVTAAQQQADAAARAAQDAQAAMQAAQDAARQAQADAQAAAGRTAAAEAAARQAQQEAEQERQRAAGLARQLAKTFLVIYIRWNIQDDIDLHLFDPSGAEFSFNRRTVPGRPGELSEDTQIGPGTEVWEIRDAPPGDYRVEAELFAIKGTTTPATVQGRVFHRDGSHVLSPVPLRRAHERVRLALVHVDSDGNVTLR